MFTVMLMCCRVAWAYQQRHVQKLNTSYKFTNKVFSGWDFNIANEESAYLKCVSIRRDFEVRCHTSAGWYHYTLVGPMLRITVVNVASRAAYLMLNLQNHCGLCDF